MCLIFVFKIKFLEKTSRQKIMQKNNKNKSWHQTCISWFTDLKKKNRPIIDRWNTKYEIDRFIYYIKELIHNRNSEPGRFRFKIPSPLHIMTWRFNNFHQKLLNKICFLTIQFIQLFRDRFSTEFWSRGTVSSAAERARVVRWSTKTYSPRRWWWWWFPGWIHHFLCVFLHVFYWFRVIIERLVVVQCEILGFQFTVVDLIVLLDSIYRPYTLWFVP